MTHLAQKERTLVSLDWWCCQACPAGAAGSCTGRCRPAAAAAGWGCRWSRRGRVPRTGRSSQQGTGRRMERRCHGDALSGTTPPQVRGPSAALDSPPPRPSPPRSGGDRGAWLCPRHMSLPNLRPPTQGHLQRGEGIKFRIWPVACLGWVRSFSDFYQRFQDIIIPSINLHNQNIFFWGGGGVSSCKVIRQSSQFIIYNI